MKVPHVLKRIQEEARAQADWWHTTTDDPHKMAQTIAVVCHILSTICEKILKEHMQELGKRGGQRTSIAKVEAVSRNAKLGGRPVGCVDTKPRKTYKKRLTKPCNPE